MRDDGDLQLAFDELAGPAGLTDECRRRQPHVIETHRGKALGEVDGAHRRNRHPWRIDGTSTWVRPVTAAAGHEQVAGLPAGFDRTFLAVDDDLFALDR